MKTVFKGFPPEGLKFLRDLKKNNRREWFQARKDVYEERLKAPMIELVGALTGEMMKFAPDHVLEPSKALYRIYRDTRFSKDKTPYKTHIAAVFPRRGLCKTTGAGYYFHISPEEVGIGGGIYMPGPEELLAVRNHMAAHYKEFESIRRARAVRSLFGEMEGEKLSRVPKGFEANHPAAELLKYKQFLLWKTLDPGVAGTPQLFAEILRHFLAMRAFLEFLNKPLMGTPQKAKEAFMGW